MCRVTLEVRLISTISMATQAPESEHSLTEISHMFQTAATSVEALHGRSRDEVTKQATILAKELVASLENPEDVVMHYAWEVDSSSWFQI